MRVRFLVGALLCAAWSILPAQAVTPGTHNAAESAVFGVPDREQSLDAIIIEDHRDPEDRRKKAKGASQRFREALEGGEKPLGLFLEADGRDCFRAARGAKPQCVKSGPDAAPMMDRFAPYGAATAFQAGSSGFGSGPSGFGH